MNKLILVAFLLITFSCVLKYTHDEAFMNSAYANSSEFLAYLNGTACKDMDGIVGACFKRVKANHDLVIKLHPQNYAYTYRMNCSEKLNYGFSRNVLKGKSLEHTIEKIKYEGLPSFTCIGHVYPEDRPAPVGIKFTFRVEVINQSYVALPNIHVTLYKGKRHIVLGKHALHSRVYQKGKWKRYKKATSVKVKSDKVKAVVESYAGRVQTYGF
jgi:hypothetical protein